MMYLLVIVISLGGIIAILLLHTLLRNRNIRRIVHHVRRGFSSVRERNAKFLPDTPVLKPRKSPRSCVVELQQVRTLLRQAEKAIAKQDARGAERFLIQALTIQPEAHAVKSELARLYLDTCREQKAEALYRELVLEVAEPSLYGNLGIACYRQGKFVEACHAYQQALNLDPKNPERSYDLGRACFAAGRYEDAAPLLEKASASLTKNIELLHLLAHCYAQLQEREKAEEIYRRINRLDPRDEEVKAKISQMATA